MGVTDRRLLHSETLGVAGRSVPQGPDPCPHEIDHCRWNAERTWDKARHPQHPRHHGNVDRFFTEAIHELLIQV